MIRVLRLSASLVLLSAVPSAAAEPLRLEDLERRILPASAFVEARSELSRLDAEVASSGGFLAEAPALGFEAGPRREDGGGTRADASARIELPLTAARRERERLAAALDDGRGAVLDAATEAARLALRGAFFDAWFVQERLHVLDLQIADTERLMAVTARRVESGAQAPYEAALVEGDLVRLFAEADAARRERSAAWAELRSVVDLPREPEPLAAPAFPAPETFERGAAEIEMSRAVRAVAARRGIGEALADYELGRRRSRFTLEAALGREGSESVATVGGAYRLPLRGETAAFARERETSRDVARRLAENDAAALETRLAGALVRARRFGPLADPASFDAAIRAVSLRLESGKEGPAAAIPVRRQLMDARAAALERVRDALALGAEIAFLTSGVKP